MLGMPGGSVAELGIGRLAPGGSASPLLPLPPVHSSGRFRLFFPMPSVPRNDPHAIKTAFTYDSFSGHWTFSAKPIVGAGVTKIGTTDDSQDCWRAAVGTESGAFRYYFGTSSTGPFVPALSYGHLSADANGFTETEPNGRIRQYNSNGLLTEVDDHGAVHTYTWNGGNPTIEANTTPLSRMVITASSGNVTKAVMDTNGAQWVTMAEVDVGWSGDAITSITMHPSGNTLSFTYYATGDLATYEDCSGRVNTIRYEGAL